MNMPNEPARWQIYATSLGLLAVLVVLIGVDVARGGDAANWAFWIASVLGLSTSGLAVANTRKRPPLLHEHDGVLHGHPDAEPGHTH